MDQATWRAAKLLVECLGKAAHRHAVAKEVKLRQDGDEDGAARWTETVMAIECLQHRRPPERDSVTPAEGPRTDHRNRHNLPRQIGRSGENLQGAALDCRVRR